MKKNKALLFILSILIILTAYFIFQSTNTTIKSELRDFAVKDTGAISKIFIANRNGNSITLERKNKTEWLLNEKDEPRPDILKFLLVGIYKIDIQSRVAKAAYNNVIKSLASSGIKCEIFMNGSPIPSKTYYVGGQTEDGLGTFMIIENSNAPFIVEVPGFNGYLTPRYSVDIDVWKQPKLFYFEKKGFKSLAINYSNFPEKSFVISLSKGKYTIESPINNKYISRIDSVALDNYLSHYLNAFYESLAKELSTVEKDSLLLCRPSVTVSLTNNTGQKNEVYIYPIPISLPSPAPEEKNGIFLKYDEERMYGYIKQEKKFVIIQHRSFDKYLRQYNDFDLQKPKASN